MSLYCHWVLFKAKAVNKVADVTADRCDGGGHMSTDTFSPRSGENQVAPVRLQAQGLQPQPLSIPASCHLAQRPSQQTPPVSADASGPALPP